MRAKLLLTLLLATVALSSCKETKHPEKDATDVTCQENVMSQLDGYLKQIELVPNGNSKHKFPESIPKLREACKINTNIMNILTNLANKCMTGFKKNVMQVTLYSVKKSQKALCRTKPTREMRKFVESGKCVNAGRQRFRTCLKQTVNNVLKVKAVDDKMKIPLICCEVVRAKQCLMHEAKLVPECKPEHIDTINGRFNNVAMNGMNIACGDYNEETDRCSRVLPPKGVTVDRGNKSLMMTMFELLDSLPLSEDTLPGAVRR